MNPSKRFHFDPLESSPFSSHVSALAIEIESLKRMIKYAERAKPDTDEPWSFEENTSSTAPCRFHDAYLKQARMVYAARFENTVVLQSETEGVVFLVEFELEGERSRRFVGSSNDFQRDITYYLRCILFGDASRLSRPREDAPGFNAAAWMQQVGHAYYRASNSLDFFKIRVLVGEFANLELRKAEGRARVECDAITEYKCWYGRGDDPDEGSPEGMNIWDTRSNTFHLKWGVSLDYLYTLLDCENEAYKYWTIGQVYKQIIKPKLKGQNCTFIEYVQKRHPEAINEQVDWFISPGCVDCCNWKKVIYSAISTRSPIPPPVESGNRYVYIDVFYERVLS